MNNTIELFAGCGGLLEGFERSGFYKLLSGVEWEESPVNELRSRLKSEYRMDDADQRLLQFDIQRTSDLINGWKDDKYGCSAGMDKKIGRASCRERV